MVCYDTLRQSGLDLIQDLSTKQLMSREFDWDIYDRCLPFDPPAPE